MKRNFILTITGFVLSMAILSATPTAPIAASTGEQVIGGFTNTGQAIGFTTNDNGAPKQEFAVVLGTYATGFAAIMSAFFIVLTVYGGWLWMTAQGNEEKVQTGKMRILSGIIGLAIIISGRLIAELVIYYLGQATISPPTAATN